MKPTLVKLILFFLAGILAGFYFKLPLHFTLAVGFLILSIFLFAFYRAGKLWDQDIFFGSITYVSFLFLGFATVQLHLPSNQPGHYLNHEIKEDNSLLVLTIIEELKPDFYNQKFIAEVNSINGNHSSGRIIIYTPLESTETLLNVDDEILIHSKLKDLKPPLNPYQFDYRQYLNNKKVYKEIKLQDSTIIDYKHTGNSVKGVAANARSSIISNLKLNGFKNDELAIIQALLLGEKKDVSKEIYQNYANAGVIHILAVSGLHVGIILWLLNLFFAPLKALKHGRTAHLLLVVATLWGYAFLAGLSPSIVRAVTMFTFVAIGMQLQRKSNVLNSIFASFLILLLFNPYYIFEVGFQLSYAAVISIVLFQPLLFEFLKPKNKIIKFYWGIFTVTIAAQIGVLPLSLFYFHQFPGLFFLSNLLIIPFLGIVLGFGVFVIILALANILPQFLVNLFETMIHFLNLVVSWIAQQQGYVFKDVPFTELQAIAAYLVVFASFFLLKNFKIKSLKYVLFSIIIFQSTYIFQNQKSNSESMVIFHKSRKTAVGLKKNQQLALFSNLELPKSETFIKNYLLGEGTAIMGERNLPDFLFFKNKKILLVDSMGVYNIKNLVPDYILLRNSPKINMERMVETHPMATFVADGSNYPYLIELWKESLKKKKAPFHITSEKGAFIVNE